MRLFVALNLPAAERRAIYEATEPVREGTPGITWAAEENLHITLKFLGEEPGAGAVPMRDRLRRLAAAHAPVELALGGVDAFPNLRAPRIVWMGAAASPAVQRLQRDVDAACGDFGYARDARPFRPHVTLGRVKARLDAGALRRLGERARAVHYARTVEVRSVDLMSSTLTPAGSRYAVVESALLGGA